jgi:chromosome segregation ATPase
VVEIIQLNRIENNDDLLLNLQIEDLVSKLNIQVDNLCQFLPQDKVADFSKMNPQQLLENTEKCIGKIIVSRAICSVLSLNKKVVDV